MRHIEVLALLSIILVFSCKSDSQSVASTTPADSGQTQAVAAEPAPPAPVTQPVPVSEPASVSQPAPVSQPALVSQPAQTTGAVFDRSSISEAQFEATKSDVQALIADLNSLIKAKNYNAWLDYLSDSYKAEINSEAFLAERTDELYRRDQIVAQNLGRDPRRVTKKVLKTARDYFDSVVVPSRSNDRMDDIDFVSENRVKAYSIDSRGQRVVLYDLELIDGKWKIIN